MTRMFKPLSLDEVRIVVENGQLYRDYTDALALLQDLVCEYAPAQSHPVFTSEEARLKLQAILLKMKAYSVEVKAYPAIHDNLELNLSAATGIRNDANAIKSFQDTRQVEEEATQFVAQIAKTYGSLRAIRGYRAQDTSVR